MSSTAKIENPNPLADKATRQRLELALEIGLEDTFPASDPVAVTEPGPKREIASTER